MTKYLFPLVYFFIFFHLSCNAGTNTGSVSGLEGKWLVKFHSNDIGVVEFGITFETSGNSFLAFTRKGADRGILGFWKSSLARVFTNDFKNGSLIRITDGVITAKNDTLLLKGIFRSAMGNYHFNGTVYNNELRAELTNARHEGRGHIAGIKSISPQPLRDYPGIITEALDTTRVRIYSPEVLKSKEWKKFSKRINKTATGISNDVELVFAFYYFASKLPFSHFSLLKLNNEPVVYGEKYIPAGTLSLQEVSGQTAILKISSFGGTASEVDSVFTVIRSAGYKNLIVDLRNNSGGSIEAGMAFARNVVDSVLLGGVFLTRKWFVENTSIPGKDRYHELPCFSEASFDLIVKGIHREKGLVLKVIPAEDPFRGKLYIITNRRTASTCEPLVYGLQYNKRAVIVGEKTAGAMLNGERFNLESGFSLFVPTADYYTVDGYRIDQKGVAPDIETKPGDAIEHVINHLIRE